MKTKSRLMAMLLTLAMVVTFMPAVTQTADAASKQKVQLVTKEKNNSGDNITYTYNKKGLVSKQVAKYSYKDDDSDYSQTVTTTYKYNKKNRITKETEKKVTKETTYKTSPTTGKRTSTKLGTVTTTETSVSKYTYKKGAATKKVTTTTRVKSGSITQTEQYRVVSSAKQVNGQYLAGYNDRNADGTTVNKNTKDNAYYYTGAVASATGTRTTTTTYKDNGNGTYTEVTMTTDSAPNYQSDYVETYYRKDAATGRFVPCTEEQYRDYDYYYDNFDYDWEWEDVRFTRTNSVNIVITGGAQQDVDTSRYEQVVSNKTVTTTKYTNDKKKRAKKAVVTEVSTNSYSEKSSYNNTDVYTDYIGEENEYTEVSNSQGSDSSSYVSKSTSSYTEKYTYDKKGRVKKTTYTDNGVENSSSTSVTNFGTSSSSSTRTYKNGRVDKDSSVTTYSATGPMSTVVTNVANNVKTVTTTEPQYTSTTTWNSVYNGESNTTTSTNTSPAVNETKRSNVKAQPSSATTTYTYDKQGNLKTAKRSGKNTDVVSVYNEQLGSPIYEFDADGELEQMETTVQHSTSRKYTNENTVKDGTNRIKKALEMHTYKIDGYASPGYYLDGRVVYTLKAKSYKKSYAKEAEKQQWIIQNGYLNGVIGL